jgi:hypothetical protein
MEPKQELVHPDEAQLASFLDPAQAPEAQAALLAHLDVCTLCDARLEQIEPAFSQYRHWLNGVHARIPRSPRRDRDLWSKMERIEAGRTSRRRVGWRLAWSSCVAAALIVFALLMLPGERGSELRAETLLAQAATSATRTTASRRLLIRTRTASFVRTPERHPDTPEEQAVRARFAAANYDWREPLAPRSYSDWRQSLKHRTSKVFATRNALSGQPEQRIETTTDDGALHDASLTLDASLLPVKGSFRFADQEWIEISTVPDSEPSPSAAPAVAVSIPPAAVIHESSPHSSVADRELAVRLAIDAMQISAGEPIEVSVEPTGGILVTTYHLTAEQQGTLRASLDRIDNVTVRAADQAGTLRPQVADRPGRILHASQDVSYEAHLLADLATHFDSVEGTLGASSRNKLWALRMKHAVELNRDLETLRRELEWEHSSSPDVEPQLQTMASCASMVDRLISELYAGTGVDSEQTELRRQLHSEFAQLQRQAGGYLKYLEESGTDLP